MPEPKLFISYSWTDSDHEDWVLELATRLRHGGVDAILDKWDLKEGQDAHAFMERMVSDPEITKVLLICDRAYVDKADRRAGGVGTEAQIISAEIYSRSDQEKFVAVVKERDAEGKACVPTYCKSRKYIDLSDPGSYEAQFEQLLRWAFDQPLYAKPALGKKPPYLDGGDKGLSLATSHLCGRAIEAVKQGRNYKDGAIADYFQTLMREFEKLRVEEVHGEFDDLLIEQIGAFLPYRNEAIELFDSLAQYHDPDATPRQLHRFFESLIPYLDAPESVSSYHEHDFDVFRFLVHELFLYAIASLIKNECFHAAGYLLRTPYFTGERRGNEPLASFVDFRRYLRSLDRRNQRLKLRRLSVRADLLLERCEKHGPIRFVNLMQADFVCYLYDVLHPIDEGLTPWYPETLVYARTRQIAGPFEIFARARSSKYAGHICALLDLADIKALQECLDELGRNPRRIPHWEHETFNPLFLCGRQHIGSLP